MEILNVYFDGGKGGKPKRAYGSYEVCKFGQVVCYERRMDFGVTPTSNEAEYLSLFRALDALLKMGAGKDFCLAIESDSALVVNQLKGRWKIKHPHMQRMCRDVGGLLKQFAHWTLIWKPRQFNVARFGH